MNSSWFLHAAFGATWIIHLTYCSTLARRYWRLRRELDEAGKTAGKL